MAELGGVGGAEAEAPDRGVEGISGRLCTCTGGCCGGCCGAGCLAGAVVDCCASAVGAEAAMVASAKVRRNAFMVPA